MTLAVPRAASGSTARTAARRMLAALAAAVCAAVVPSAPARADEVRDRSWHLTQLKVAEAHRITQGEGVTVAIIDTGVDATHPDLAGGVLPGVDLLDPANRNRGQRDAQGHGTAIASLIAGRGHGPNGRDGVLGIAPKASILPLNVYDPRWKGATGDSVARAIRIALERGADVICVALAGSFNSADPPAIRAANQRGVLVVAGVGNAPAVTIESPANIKETVAVTGFDRAGRSVTTVQGVIGTEIDVAAPGGQIQAALPGRRYYAATGTSSSTAIVAGALALIRARYPKADRNEQLQRLVWTTDDIGEPGKDWVYGWGGLNLVKALTTEPREPAGAAPTTAAVVLPRAAVPAADEDGAFGTGLVLAGGGILAVAVVGLTFLLASRIRRRRRAGWDGGTPNEPASGRAAGAGGSG